MTEINETMFLLLIFAVAFIITFASTPFVKLLAVKIGAVDVPKDGRRMHKKAMPLIGGLAMFYGFVVSILVFLKLDNQLTGMLLGALMIVILGIVDDCKALKAKPKFLVQILAACIPMIFGITINSVVLPGFERIMIPSPFSEILTVLWIVGVTNAVNFIDGLDGLAAGVSSIASVSMLFITLLMPDSYETAVICAGLVGCCIGFLPFNSNPAKIFMGDTGAMFLGFVLACVSIQGAYKSYTLISFVLPFIVLGLPIFDTLFAIIRRMRKHKPIMSADRGHLHHRLIDMGFTQKQSVTILYSVSMLLGLSAVVMTAFGTLKGVILLISVAPILVGAVIFARQHNKHKDTKENTEEGNENE